MEGSPDFVDSSSSDDVSDSSSFEEGEKTLLLKSYEQEVAPSVVTVQIAFENRAFRELDLLKEEKGDHYLSPYGCPLSSEEASKQMPPGDGGLVWHATIIPDDYFVNGKLRSSLNKRDFDYESQSIKPRRPSLIVTATDFFSSLTRIDGEEGSRWVFSGVLNGWPSLTCLELLSFECRKDTNAGKFTRKVLGKSISGTTKWTNHWSVDKEGRDGTAPAVPKLETNAVRAILRGAPWSSVGWSHDSPGFVFWYEAQHPEKPRLTYGTNILDAVGDEKCTDVHMISHRYAMARESPKDLITYHSLVLLEWDHGNYCTIVEGAYLNGIGGYKGKCNWYHDCNEPVTQLYRTLPPEMISPWLTSHTEIRCYDVAIESLDELKTYIGQYDEGSDVRFVDPHYTFSHPARLSYRSKSHIAQYLLNYIGRDTSYHELKRNCQTFAADLCCFLAGKKGIVPFHPVNRFEYRNRTHFFMYDSSMYEKAKSS